jgi:nucleoid-associated protein YgaU
VKASVPAPSAKPGLPKAAPKAAAKPVAVAAKATHTVRSGDTLGSIAQKYYGDSSKWKGIVSANPDTLHGSKSLQPGMKLKIPRESNAKKK